MVGGISHLNSEQIFMHIFPFFTKSKHFFIFIILNHPVMTEKLQNKHGFVKNSKGIYNFDHLFSHWK